MAEQIRRPKNREQRGNDDIYDTPGHVASTHRPNPALGRADEALGDIDRTLDDNQAFRDGLSPDEEPGASQEPEQADDTDASSTDRSAMSPEDIASREKDGLYRDEDGAGSDEADSLPDEGGKRKRRARLSGKQKGLIGGGIGLLVGGVFGISSILHGPLQFIHISKILSNTHFGFSQSVEDSRVFKFARWLKDPNKPERLRMTLLGNVYTDKLEARMKRAGYDLTLTDDHLRTMGDVYIDSSKGRYAGLDMEEIPDYVKKRYKIDVEFDVNSERYVIPGEELGKFKQSRLINDALVDAGYSKVGAAIRARFVKTRVGWTLHPIKRLDRRILGAADKAYIEWKKKRQTAIDNGTKPLDVNIETDDDGSDSDRTTTIADAQEGLDDIAGADAPKDPTALRGRIAGSKAFRAGAGATAVLGVACVIKGIADTVDTAKFVNVALPMMRIGGEFISLGSQVMSGQDIDMEQLGYYMRDLQDEDKPFASAITYQASVGNELTGSDIPEFARITKEKNTAATLLGHIPGLGTACSVANSVIGQVVTTAIDIVTGPVGAGIGAGASLILGPHVIDWLVNVFSSGKLDLDLLKGADLMNVADHGTKLLSNESAKSSGGRELTEDESRQIKTYNYERVRYENDSKNFFARYLDVSDPYSLSGSAVARIPTQPSMLISSLFNYNLFSGLTRMFSGKVYAQTESEYQYPFPSYGFSIDELSDSRFDNPFENGRYIQQWLDSSDTAGELKEKAESCFGVKLSESDGSLTSIDDEVKPYSDIGSECANSNEMTLRLRFYILDTLTMESYACYEGESSACSKLNVDAASTEPVDGGSPNPTIPAGSEIVGDPYTSSVDVACAEGTVDLGVHEGYVSLVPVDMRLCALPNLSSSSHESIPGDAFYVEGADGKAIVNSRVSGAWFALINDAISNGINLSASSTFRTMTHQQDLCNKNALCSAGTYSAVARPGNSPHQAGVAIDFANMGGSAASGRTCENRQTWDSDGWRWLHDNANRYGFKQYSNEAWHWDASPMSNRC